MKLIAATLAALFLAMTATPANAATTRTTTVKTALIPGANGCCLL